MKTNPSKHDPKMLPKFNFSTPTFSLCTSQPKEAQLRENGRVSMHLAKFGLGDSEKATSVGVNSLVCLPVLKIYILITAAHILSILIE